MFGLAMRTVRFRWPSFLATFVAMAFSAIMMISAGGLLETGLRDVVPPQRLAAAPLVVAGDASYSLPDNPVQTLSERVQLAAELVDTVAAVPGVAKAVPDLQFPTAVLRDGTPVNNSFGHGWSSASLMPYMLTDGNPPAGAGDVALDRATADQAGVTVGGTVHISVHGRAAAYTVSGIVAPAGRSTVASVFFADATAGQLSGARATVAAIGVFPQPGTPAAELGKQISAALAGHRAIVLAGDDRGRAEFPNGLSVTDLMLIAELMGGLSLVVGLLGVASALSLSFQDRHREMATLRAIGATPRQLRRMILGETTAVGLLATGLAAAPGVLFGRWLFDWIVGTGIAPAELAYHEGWLPIASAAALALGTSTGAAIIAGRRVTRTKPTEGLAGVTGKPRRARWLRPAFAVLAFGYSGGLVFVAMKLVTGPFIAGPAVWASILFIIGLWLLAPIVVKGLLVPLTAVVRRFAGAPGYLASLNARAGVTRMVAVVAPLMLLTGIGVTNIYVATTEANVHAVYTEGFSGDIVLKSGEDGFAPDALATVRGLPGAGAASEFVTSAGYVENPPDPWLGRDLAGWTMEGVTADSAAAVGIGPATSGSLANLTGDTVALAATYAKALGKNLGDTITMHLGDAATVDLRIVALVSPKPSFESIIVPATMLARHVTAGLPNYLLVSPAPGADRASLRTSLARFAEGHPGAHVADRAELTKAFRHHLDAQTLVMYLFAGIIMGFIAVTVVNTLSLATTNRRREFGLQRLTGSTTGQVLWMAACEAGLAAAVGIVLGTIAAPVTLIPFSLARGGSWLPSGPLWIYFAVVGFTVVVALSSTVIAAFRALRHPPLEAALPTM